MNNLYTSIILSLLISSLNLKAQYNPMPMSNCSWTIFEHAMQCYTNEKIFISDINYDTLINTIIYSKINVTDFSDTLYLGAYRQDTLNKKIYFICKDSINEYLLYDFNANIGDTIQVIIPPFYYPYIAPELIKIKVTGKYLSNNYMFTIVYPINLGISYLYYWIEGMGSSLGLNIQPNTYVHLHCFCKNDTIFYQSLSCATFQNHSLYIDTLSNASCQYFSNSNIINFQLLNYIEVYPNPTSSILDLNISNQEMFKSQSLQCKVYDVTGGLIYNSLITNRKFEINMGYLPDGIYLLQILNSEEILYSNKIIKNQ